MSSNAGLHHHPPPPPPAPHLSACQLHPDHPVTGFCALCLRDRLSVLHPNPGQPPHPTSLRRCKSFSVGRDPPSSLEPHRRSCDVRSRPTSTTLSTLFHLHDHHHQPADAVRPMKDHIDLDAQNRRPMKEIAGSFWVAASVFSKKLRSWRRQQKLKKQEAKPPAASGRPASEVAVDALGRRSCDTDPRFSLDTGRFSLDDQPRASWDGYLVGRSVFPRLPTMLSVVEDATVQRSDGLIPVEEDPGTPGGTLQTREYYSDTSQRRRRSLDRSGSVRKPFPLADHGEFRCASNARVSNYDYSESFDCRLPQKEQPRRKWGRAWSLWGLIQRRGRGSVSERSMSEVMRDGADGRTSRGNGIECGRHSFSGVGVMGMGSVRRSGVEMRKRRDEFVPERNRSARYSPGMLDNGMLRFYLTPMPSSRRGSVGVGRIGGSTNSITRSVLRLY